MIELILIIIFSIFWTYWEAKVDSNHFKRNQFITNHKDRWVSRVSTVVLISIVSWFYGLLCGVIFTTLFDIILNLQRGLSWNYIGTESRSDKIFSTKRLFMLKTVSLSLVLIELIIYKLVIT